MKPKYKIGELLYRSDINCYLKIINVCIPIKGKQTGYLYDLFKIKEKEPARYYENKITELCKKVSNKELANLLYE